MVFGWLMRIFLTPLAFLIFVTGSVSARAQFFLPGPSDQTEASTGNPSVAPFKWAGLLVIPDPSPKYPGAYATCTGEFIAPNVVLTAGHCVRDLPDNPTGPWPDITKATFWLQYQNRTGVPFKILCGEANPLWTVPQNYAQLNSDGQNAAMNNAWPHDYAMLLVDGTSPTGTMPYQTDWKGQYNRAARIGYPGAILDATIIQKAPGIIFSSDAVPIGGSPDIIGQWGPVVDATEGMSGGAWVVHPDQFEGKGNNVLIGVTSFSVETKTGKPVYPGGSFAAYLKAVEFDPLLFSVLNGCK